MREVADREEISIKYLEQIVRQLKASGLILSQRGAGGGYMLSRAPQRINLEEAFTSLEGDLSPIDCLHAEKRGCAKIARCSTVEMWRELEEHIRAFLRAYTLEDLADRVRAGQGTEMFYI